LRKIYGPVKENELRRIRWNDELEAIIRRENIVRFIKCQRIRWLGHIERMQETVIPKKTYGKMYATRQRGWCVHGPQKDGCKGLERQSKESRGLGAYRRGGQGPPRAVAPSGGAGSLNVEVSKTWFFLDVIPWMFSNKAVRTSKSCRCFTTQAENLRHS